MQSNSIYKIPNGKLLKVKIEHNDNKIKSIKITGDFFIYPEEAIDKIEKELIDIKLERIIVFEKLNEIVNNDNIEFIGLNIDGLTDGIMMCLK